MADKSQIEWTDATWNPVTGCSKVSPGCAHCYAETLSKRLHAMGKDGYSGKPWTPANAAENVVLRPDRLDQPLRWRRPRMVFVNSMSDLFHEQVPETFILAVWAVMEASPRHTFQILTKRPEWMRDVLAGAQEAPQAREEASYERREVSGYPGYDIDTEGTVWGKRDGRELQQEAGEQGHRRVMLYMDGVGRRELVHRLVLSTFDRLPKSGEQARHLDGDPSNNRLSNLAWGTQAENWADSKGHRTDRRYHKLTAMQVAELRIAAAAGESGYSLGQRFGISDTQARNIIRGDQWGFKVLPNVMLGVSIENRRYVHRADLLRQTPAAVRFISAEPLLGPLVPIGPHYTVEGEWRWYGNRSLRDPGLDLTGIDWLIVGGESGSKHRPMRAEWVRDLRDACQERCRCGSIDRGRRDWGLDHAHCGGRIAFFFKQWGGARAGGAALLDGREWREYPRS